jgi:ABC-2 type transport system ATP-binding protein
VTEDAVRIDGLIKTYAGRRAVDRLSLTMARGQVFALLGPNGAGKTTTIEICEGFRTPDSGTVRVLGLDPVREGSVLRPRVGVMLQDGVGGYTAARATELLELFASYAAHPRHPAELLERVGLADAAQTPVKRLSGGQRQRLSLALALVGRPELVFLDEPTAGMDPHARRGTWALIEQLRADGVSVVLTTHFLDEAEELADVVAVIDRGRLVASGTPAELTRSGVEGQIRFRARSGLRLSSLLDALPIGTKASEESPGRYLVAGEVTPQLLATLTAWCAGQDVLAEELAVERRSLEDVFLELTGRELRA